MSQQQANLPPAARRDEGRGVAAGKVLLLGEHAVVYNEPALALGLPRGLQARARFCEGILSDNLHVPGWKLTISSKDTLPVARAFRRILAEFDLLNSGIEVHVDAHLPAGKGLGSSAALAVAIARALADLTQTPLGFERLDTICHASEQVFHGQPSGIDHTIAALGGVLRYQRGTPAIRVPVSLGAPLELVIGVTDSRASTKIMVDGVRQRVTRHARIGPALTQTIGHVVEDAQEALQHADWPALGELMDINHGLLCALGVSSVVLDQAVHIAREAGALGAKLTGAGGGGCMIALAPGCQHEVAEALATLCQEVLCPTIHPR